MLYEKLDEWIANAMILVNQMKANFGEGSPDHRDAIRSLNLWREIKTEMIKATKGDEKHPGIELPNEDAELAILEGMWRKRKAAIKEFKRGGDDLLAIEGIYVNEFEMRQLEVFLPKRTDPEDVKKETMCVLKTFVELKSIEDPGFNTKTIQRYTKYIINKVKEKYPDAENEDIVGCIREYAKS